MSPENVALSLYSDSLLMPLNAVKTSTSLPASVNVFVQLRSRSARLKFFFTTQSKTASYVPTYPELFGGQFIIIIDVQRDVLANSKT